MIQRKNIFPFVVTLLVVLLVAVATACSPTEQAVTLADVDAEIIVYRDPT